MDDGIDFKRRADECGIVVGSHCFMLVGYFLVAAQEGPLFIWFQVDTEAGVFEISL